VAKFVCNALAPAEISRVVIDETRQSMEVIVPDDYLSVAIGKRGQNVRLASKLTGWGIDVKSEADYGRAMRAGYESLLELSGVGASTADALYEQGFYSVEELAKATVEELIQIKGISEAKSKALLESARKALEEMNEAGYVEEASEGEAAPEGKDNSEKVSQEAEGSKQTGTASEGL
jgi:N utilization substance protein A